MLEFTASNVMAVLGWALFWVALWCWIAARDALSFVRRVNEMLGQKINGLKAQNLALADRVAQQSQLLARAAEAKAESERRLGYLFPRGLETPPSREDALSPTWCREQVEKETGVSLIPLFHCEKCETVYEDVETCPIHGAHALPR